MGGSSVPAPPYRPGSTLLEVAGQFAQDHLLKVLALAEVIVDLPDDSLVAPRRARTSRVRARCGRTGVCGPRGCVAAGGRRGLEPGPGAAGVEHNPTGEILPAAGDARRSLDVDDGIARVGRNRLHDLRGGGPIIRDSATRRRRKIAATNYLAPGDDIEPALLRRPGLGARPVGVSLYRRPGVGELHLNVDNAAWYIDVDDSYSPWPRFGGRVLVAGRGHGPNELHGGFLPCFVATAAAGAATGNDRGGNLLP
jgi:hypothetical protein